MSKLRNRIHVVKGYGEGSYTFYPVLIVGAGASGIALGCRLKSQLGFDQFRIFDRQSGVGGTWWINRYPGVACDVPTILYSFSFRPNYGSSTLFPPGAQLVEYFNEVCGHYGIADKIQLNTDVTEVRWLEREQLWEATIAYMTPGTGDMAYKDRQAYIRAHGKQSVYLKEEKIRAKIVCSCVGGLVEPNGWPAEVLGQERFEGDVFHSARWDYGVDMRGKNVVVVGTGCSAAQFVPHLTMDPINAKSVTQIMRSPPWVVPKQKEPFGKAAYAKWAPVLYKAIPGLGRVMRILIFLGAELDFFNLIKINVSNANTRVKTESDLLIHMRRTVPDKYHQILTPNYAVGCKRRVFDIDWFPSLNDPKIQLTTQPLLSVQARGVTLGPSPRYPPSSGPRPEEHAEVRLPADVIILSNGFDISNFIHPLKVFGRTGQELHKVWEERGGPQAYMGTAMDGFPNFFMIFGPNTATGHSSLIVTTEMMVEMALKFIRPIVKGHVNTIEVKKEAEVEWTERIQTELKETVWMSGNCHSYYFTNNRWNAVTYPRSLIDFGLRCKFPTWNHWEIKYTRKGLCNNVIRRAIQLILVSFMVVGTYRTYRSPGSFESFFHDGGLHLSSWSAHVLDHLNWSKARLRGIVIKN